MGERRKQNLPYEQLLAKVQAVLTSHAKACRNVHVEHLEVYRETVDGANWSVTWLTRSGDDNDATGCLAKIRADLAALREAYDVDARG